MSSRKYKFGNYFIIIKHEHCQTLSKQRNYICTKQINLSTRHLYDEQIAIEKTLVL